MMFVSKKPLENGGSDFVWFKPLHNPTEISAISEQTQKESVVTIRRISDKNYTYLI